MLKSLKIKKKWDAPPDTVRKSKPIMFIGYNFTGQMDCAVAVN
jgi:hypothetical protein